MGNVVMNKFVVLIDTVEWLHLTILSSKGCQSEYGGVRYSIGLRDCSSGQCCGIGDYFKTMSAYYSLVLGRQVIYDECSTGRCGTK